MQLALAIALTSIYLATGLAICGVPPRAENMLLWFFVPVGIMLVAGSAGRLISRILPLPWTNARTYGPPPRRVHLSWRSAVRIPPWIPWLLFPGYPLALMKSDAAVPPAFWSVAAVALIILTLMTRTYHRQIRLLRHGVVTMALVHGRDEQEEPHNRVAVRFATAAGTIVSGWAPDLGYHVPIGDAVPVFYDEKNPRNYLVVCGSRFETDASDVLR